MNLQEQISRIQEMMGLNEYEMPAIFKRRFNFKELDEYVHWTIEDISQVLSWYRDWSDWKGIKTNLYNQTIKKIVENVMHSTDINMSDANDEIYFGIQSGLEKLIEQKYKKKILKLLEAKMDYYYKKFLSYEDS